jgi:hypothetical protein
VEDIDGLPWEEDMTPEDKDIERPADNERTGSLQVD